MAEESNRQYYERRRRESMSRANAAADPGIARVHREFADLYTRALSEPAAQVQHTG